MDPARVLYVPYRILRTPLKVADDLAERRLSRSPVRMITGTALHVFDTAAARVLREPGLAGCASATAAPRTPTPTMTREPAPAPTAEPTRPAAGPGRSTDDDTGADDSTQPEADVEQLEDAHRKREQATAAKQKAARRGNRSPAAMALEIAQVEAAAEAREQEAEERTGEQHH